MSAEEQLRAIREEIRQTQTQKLNSAEFTEAVTHLLDFCEAQVSINEDLLARVEALEQRIQVEDF